MNKNKAIGVVLILLGSSIGMQAAQQKQDFLNNKRAQQKQHYLGKKTAIACAAVACAGVAYLGCRWMNSGNQGGAGDQEGIFEEYGDDDQVNVLPNNQVRPVGPRQGRHQENRVVRVLPSLENLFRRFQELSVEDYENVIAALNDLGFKYTIVKPYDRAAQSRIRATGASRFRNVNKAGYQQLFKGHDWCNWVIIVTTQEESSWRGTGFSGISIVK
jgi:hypothetical protein